MSWCRAAAGGVRLSVRVIPRARATAIAGTRNDALLVRVTAPPVDDAANRELTAFLARALGVPGRAVRLLSGVRSRQKILEVSGVDDAACRRALTGSPAESGPSASS